MSREIAVVQAIAHRNLTKAAQTLLGICSGLTADGQLVDQEIAFLRTWLSENPDVTNCWPGNVISAKVEEILADGVVTDDERRNLVDVLSFLTGNEFGDTGAAAPAGPAAPFDTEAEVRFSNTRFCFTGTFFFGTRAACERTVEKLGGYAVPNVTSSLNFLVVGGGCSPDWANTTYGRKIETAIARRERYGVPLIVSEEAWIIAMQGIGK